MPGKSLLARTVIAAIASIGALVLAIGLSSPAGASVKRQTCRNAYVSTTGAWGSARICWTSLGGRFYKASANGTVKDTKGDGKRAALFVHTWNKKGRSWTPRLALATKKGQVRYGKWSNSKVKHGVYIYVCRVDRFNTTYNCSRNG
ncbi:hypothetical protein [Actinomadura sp. 9N215]|uniref:hypothetical protein n=1 Tax=Actinomadura sp. 9N215 TaxID=3375150 RepID=UPI00379610D7